MIVNGYLSFFCFLTQSYSMTLEDLKYNAGVIWVTFIMVYGTY